MKVIIKQRIESVAERWKKRYYTETHRNWLRYGTNKEEIYNQLLALPSLTADKIDAIIGNSTWTRLTCDECDNDLYPVLVRLGQGLDYDSSTAYVCPSCLREALRLVTRAAGDFVTGVDWGRPASGVLSLKMEKENVE